MRDVDEFPNLAWDLATYYNARPSEEDIGTSIVLLVGLIEQKTRIWDIETLHNARLAVTCCRSNSHCSYHRSPRFSLVVRWSNSSWIVEFYASNSLRRRRKAEHVSTERSLETETGLRFSFEWFLTITWPWIRMISIVSRIAASNRQNAITKLLVQW